MTRTRGTARKTQAKNKEESRADATETPAVVAQHSRRRVPFASACKKMESQLKECAEEDEKKVVPLTPVALEVTSRRMGLKKASEVRLVYSTRRSARLAEKNVEIRSGVKNDKPEILRSDLFMKEEGENVEMNVKEMSDGEPEGPEITETSLDENFKKMDGTEVSSGRKQDIPDENDESKPESNVEEILGQHSEIDEPNPEMELCVDAGVEQSSLLYETESELNGERADETELSNGGNVSMTLNESSNDFEDGDELTTTHKDADEVDLKDTIDYGVKNISLESLEFADHVKQDEVGEENETNPNPNGGKQASEEEPVGKSLTLTKKSASKANAKAKKIADISAAKENICSCGSKLVLTKDGVKIAKEVAENVDKNMEKLQVTNKSSKDENGNKSPDHTGDNEASSASASREQTDCGMKPKG
ncbi:uncharacterized protein [Henckelia pumila]|uniref:uncharacterized protein isoform X2 n=1 Tax=Henckelia pumila TaxID=405737 RepID=UPI003C6E02F5